MANDLRDSVREVLDHDSTRAIIATAAGEMIKHVPVPGRRSRNGSNLDPQAAPPLLSGLGGFAAGAGAASLAPAAVRKVGKLLGRGRRRPLFADAPQKAASKTKQAVEAPLDAVGALASRLGRGGRSAAPARRAGSSSGSKSTARRGQASAANSSGGSSSSAKRTRSGNGSSSSSTAKRARTASGGSAPTSAKSARSSSGGSARSSSKSTRSTNGSGGSTSAKSTRSSSGKASRASAGNGRGARKPART